MREVKISKSELRARIAENRKAHRALYERAIEGYRGAVISWFNDELNNAIKGSAFETYFSMPKPEDHTKDYDQVIDMLDMSVDPTITLTHAEFSQYVRDDWGWKQSFTASTAGYIGENGVKP